MAGLLIRKSKKTGLPPGTPVYVGDDKPYPSTLSQMSYDEENYSEDVLHLSHNFGYKWSLFIVNYVTSIFHSVLGAKTNTVISTNAVNIEIIKKK